MAAAPSRIFGVPVDPQSTIAVDLAARWTLPDTGWQTHCDWSPFAGMPVQGRLVETVLHGQVAYANETVLAAPGAEP